MSERTPPIPVPEPLKGDPNRTVFKVPSPVPPPKDPDRTVFQPAPVPIEATRPHRDTHISELPPAAPDVMAEEACKAHGYLNLLHTPAYNPFNGSRLTLAQRIQARDAMLRERIKELEAQLQKDDHE